MKKQQRSEAKAECASSAESNTTWKDIDFHKCECKVRKLQVRIAKAHTGRRYNKVKALQHLLVTSFEAKALAVRKVTSNKGKRTAGVDHIKWDTDAKKIEAIRSLTRRGYKALPLKRVNIPKANGKTRPLGIPTMKDRAMQALYLMALEPITESEADANSYGFRKFRGTADAIDALHRWLSKSYSPEWCDRRTPQMAKQGLLSRMDIGGRHKRLLQPTLEGTPQGGIISPTLANATLDGMERMLKEKYKANYVNGKLYYPKVNLVRYADDFIVTADKRETLLEIKEMLTAFLKERGLTLSEEKTLITHISEGFDFLGFNVRKYNGTLLIKPSKKSQKRFTDKLHEVVLTKGKALSQQELIEKLNPIIRGWGNYYSHVVSKEVFCRCDHILINQLKRWSYRRHTNKSREWIRNKYFIRKGCRNWIFGFVYVCGGIEEKFTVQQLTEIPIKRHIKIKCEANPFDPLWDEYFERRKLKSARQRA